MTKDPAPTPAGHAVAPLETVITPKSTDLGDGFLVKRALPTARCRQVGPFVFFDQMGPCVLGAGQGLDVRPHPHIGLATVTYLFEGEILHRDSLGVVQPIRPGELNWMTAGRGIVHSERTPPALRRSGSKLSGIQVWVALPEPHEEIEPSFVHHGAAALPLVEGEGLRLRLIIGELAGARSPVTTLSDMLYADVQLTPGARFSVPAQPEERAVYLVEGAIELTPGGERFDAGQLLVLRAGAEAALRTLDAPTRLMLFGGEPLDGPRYVWWNFVSSSRERIEQAKADWRAGRFPLVPGETEFIPLPGDAPAPVRYP